MTGSEWDPHETRILGGAEKVTIVVVDYDEEWPVRFELERERIVGALGGRAVRVDHVGSTSVPGLAAKPIIDIVLTVADSADESAYLADLLAAGYELRVREPDWHEHRMLRTPARDVHLHVFSTDSSEPARMLRFRDRLREDPDDRDEYAAAKRGLAARDWPTMQDYADAKTGIVQSIIDRAAG